MWCMNVGCAYQKRTHDSTSHFHYDLLNFKSFEFVSGLNSALYYFHNI